MRDRKAKFEMTIDHADANIHRRDIRAWKRINAAKYTSVLRQIESPLTQGILGARLSPHHLAQAFERVPTPGGDRSGRWRLGEDGRFDGPPMVDSGHGYIDTVLAVEFLRGFTATDFRARGVSSVQLTELAQHFLGDLCPGLSVGRMVWAAVAVGLYISVDYDSSIIKIRVDEQEVARLARSGPAAATDRLKYLRRSLNDLTSGRILGIPPAANTDPRPKNGFHHWLEAQIERSDAVGAMARDYVTGFDTGRHRSATWPADLKNLLFELEAGPDALAAADEVDRHFSPRR